MVIGQKTVIVDNVLSYLKEEKGLFKDGETELNIM